MTASPTLTEPGDATRLLSLLQQQTQLYQRVHELSDSQSELVRGGDSRRLLALLTQRQKAINQLVALDRDLAPYRDSWSEVWGSLEQAEQRRVGAAVGELRELIESILERDEGDQAEMRTRKDELSGELKKVSDGGTAARAYQAPNAGSNRFTNQQG